MARPEKHIDWKLVEQKMQAGCNGIEIAADFYIDENTFYRRFEKEYEMRFTDCVGHFRSVGKGNIKWRQFTKAMQGNTQMLIWLGRILLDQREPDFIPLEAPRQDDINKDHKIMELEHKISLLEAHGNQPKTE